MVSPFLRLAVLVAVVCGAWPMLAMAPPDLGHARSFAVLGGSAVRNTGSTSIAGNVGVSPGRTVTGLPNGEPDPGDVYRDDALARQAQNDSAAAFRELAGRTCGPTLRVLTGTLEPGTHCASSPLTGTLILDAKGNPDAYWIIKISGSLTTAPGSSVVLVGGGKESNIFWYVDGSATLGAASSFLGNLLARDDITLGSGAIVSGRLLVQTGAVTLTANRVTICCEPIAITTSLSGGTAGMPYGATLMATGGIAPYSFSVTSGDLPPGLTLSGGGVLSGTPSGCGGTFTFTVSAVDANGCPGTRAYTVEIACTTTSGIVLSPEVLPPATVGMPYSAPVMASGGTPRYVFTVTCGTLPPGLSLTEGMIAGTPETAGTFTFAITATDALLRFGSRCYTLVIAAPLCPTITIEPATLRDGILGTVYGEALSASGGSGSYTFTARSEALPDGVKLLSSGTFTGVPTKAGCYTFTVIVRDTLTGCLVIQAYTICISCGPVPTILPPMLRDGIVGVLYVKTITATGGSGSYTFTARTAALPPGLSLLPTTGVLSGRPTTAGCYTFTVTVFDDVTGCFVSKTYTVCFACPLITINPPTLPTGLVNAPYPTTMLTATPADRTYTFAIVQGSGSLPPGMEPLPTDGTVSGTPTSSGVFTFTVIATDIYGCSGTRDYTIVINPVQVPTGMGNAPALSERTMLLLALLLACAGVVAMRRSGV